MKPPELTAPSWKDISGQMPTPSPSCLPLCEPGWHPRPLGPTFPGLCGLPVARWAGMAGGALSCHLSRQISGYVPTCLGEASALQAPTSLLVAGVPSVSPHSTGSDSAQTRGIQPSLGPERPLPSAAGALHERASKQRHACAPSAPLPGDAPDPLPLPAKALPRLPGAQVSMWTGHSTPIYYINQLYPVENKEHSHTEGTFQPPSNKGSL